MILKQRPQLLALYGLDPNEIIEEMKGVEAKRKQINENFA